MQTATGDTPQTQEILEKYFPTVEYAPSPGFNHFIGILCALISLLPVCGYFMDQLEIYYKISCVVLSMIMLFGSWKYWSHSKKRSLILTSSGLQLSDWVQELKFSEIKSFNYVNTNGVRQLVMGLYQKRAPLTAKPWFKLKRKAVSITISAFKIKSDEIAKEIYRYYLREKKEF